MSNATDKTSRTADGVRHVFDYLDRLESAVRELREVRLTHKFDCPEMWAAVNKITEMVPR